MDTAAGFSRHPEHEREDATDGAVTGVALQVGGDERRMHVRAYNYWVSLLQGRAYPSIEDLDPANITDFGPHSVLLDFSNGVDDPKIQFLGGLLRAECGIGIGITHVAEVPSRSLLSRLTDHYLQIIANRAPIGFEAEFVSHRGHNTLYRGILMPFSSDEDTIDFIYGVINWKELVDADTQAQLNAEIDAARTVQPVTRPTAIWADGPGSSFAEEPTADPVDDPTEDALTELGDEAGLADRLHAARETVAAVRASNSRSRAALYRALGHAFSFARAAEREAEDYAELLADAGIAAQARAPMTPVVKLIFGADYDKTRLTEFSTVLAHAHRLGLRPAGFADFLETAEGGIKGIVAAERKLRRPAAKPDRFAAMTEGLRKRPPLARIEFEAGNHEFVVLLARAGTGGMLDVVAAVGDDAALVARIARQAS